MELKQGYKQTEIGVMPEEWGITELGKIGVFSKGSGVRKDQSNSGEIACVRYGELYTKHNNYIKTICSFISKEVSLQAKRLKKGDILFAGSGETKAEIGKSAAFIDEIEAYAGGDIVILTPKEFDSMYLGYLLNASFIQSQKASRGQGDAVVHISSNNLSSIKIPQPTLQEQTAIANALSDMDALISQTEKLIEKKKAIKQGAMQELLKPKDGWVTKRLGDVSKFYKGSGLPKSDLTEYGRYKCIHYGELFTFYKENIDNIKSRTNKNFGAFLSNVNDVLMPTSDVTPNGLATASCINENNIVLGGDILVIRSDSNKIDGVFLSYSIKFNRQQIMKLVSGSTVYHLYGSDMSKFIFSFPEIKIQQRISRLLIDMEDELNKYQTKLTKLKQQKQGMMQALLTGKIRLVS